MRRTNLRLTVAGIALFGVSAGFFLSMQALAPRSNDPIAMMQTVGEVSGAVGAIAVLLLLFGMIGKRASR